MLSHAEIAIPLPIFRTFTYVVPEPLRERIRPGMRALVPFARRLVMGLVVRLHEECREDAKPVEGLPDEEPLLSPHLLELGRWVGAYYVAPPGEALRAMLPPGLLGGVEKKLGMRTASALWPVRRRLAIVEISADGRELTARQRIAWEELRGQPLPILVRRAAELKSCSLAILKGLAAKRIIRVESVDVPRSPWEDSLLAKHLQVMKHALTPDQERVLRRIEAHLGDGGFRSLLIHGVTGSGKTEVYLNAIANCLARGRSALMLVPEIGLTPQVSRYFRGWFGEQVAISHSALSEGERFDQWRRIRKGQAPVVVGTRSAVFAPLAGLGLIIVDEEHDGSYKQEELPRYHARDTALKRGQLEGALVVLGSATPQLETYYQSVHREQPEYECLSSRVLERSLPTVHIVDMREEFNRRGQAVVISELLEQAIRDRLERRQQVLILLNRRGYSPLLLCRSCGQTETCVNCSISLTYHRESNRLSCHYCGYSRSVPAQCRECGKEYIYFVGQGTEKIQEILRERFPEAVVDRLDRDTTQRKGSLTRILDAFAAGRTHILVGTQMIAKGHDFPGVTLVGVLAAEQSLRLADFRAAERTFQLLTQVAGRSGRGEQPGDVIIQTYYPNHYSLRYACAQDYRLFFKQEIEFRRNFRYPPFTALANLVVQGSSRKAALELAELLAARLAWHRARCSDERRLRILGPAPAALERLKGEYRFQLLIKTTNRRELHQVLEGTVADVQLERGGLKGVTVDVDPVSLM